MRRASEGRLPDFIAVGPQRTGSTWLDSVLRGRANLPRGAKETDFFSRHYAKGLGWYRDYFTDARGDTATGEIDPNYFGVAQARERIARDIPGCRVICTFRDPTERAYSSYRTMRRDAWTRVGFEETVARNEVIRESSRYAHHLREWQRLFGADRVLVLLYDDLESNPQSYLDRVCAFLQIPAIPLAEIVLSAQKINEVAVAPRSRRIAQNARNARDWMREHKWRGTLSALERLGVWRWCFGGGEQFAPMDADVEMRLRAYFRSEVEAFEALTGRDLSDWKFGRQQGPRQLAQGRAIA
ncbi:MAG: sulfotransferase family protein [Candidatus Binataceae bacterium]